MQHLAKRSLALTIAAGGLLAVGASCAVADSTATGNSSGSPGVASGNDVQVPVNVPVNVCGITTNILALLDPAAGDTCTNDGPSRTVAAPPAHGRHHSPGSPGNHNPGSPQHHAPAPSHLSPGPVTDAAPPATRTAPSGTVDERSMAPTASTLAKTGAGDVAGYAAIGGTLIAGGVLARRLAGRHTRRDA